MNTTTDKYTAAQADQMRHDTTITYSGTSSLAQAHVAAAPLAETDERFFMDREWLAWFADEHPEWKVIGEMADVYEATNYLYVWTITLAPVWADAMERLHRVEPGEDDR